MIDILYKLEDPCRHGPLNFAAAQEIRQLRDKAERLRAIVAKLPVTADGVPVVPGMKVWRIEHPTTLGECVLDVSPRGIHIVGKSDWYESRAVCSTREAAEAAREERWPVY